MDMPQQNEEFTMKRLFEEIVSSKNEVKNTIAASEFRLLLEIQTLKNKVASLTEENEKLKRIVESAEQKNRRNNLVIFGLRKPPAGNLLDYIGEQIHQLLGVTVAESDVNDYYTLGNSDISPIKIEFLSNLKKKQILSNAKKLKGTGVSIAHDLTIAQREELKILRKFLLQARANSTKKSYIKGNTLVVGLKTYTLEELEESTGITASNSAPSTPNPSAKNQSDSSGSEIEANFGDSAFTEQTTSRNQEKNRLGTPRDNKIKTKKIPNKTIAKLGMKLRGGSNGC